METLDRIDELGYGDEWCDGCGQGRDQCRCPVEEAYDDEVDGPNPFGTDSEVLKQLVRELQKLERDTSRVYREATQSRRREDFADMVLNELGMTLTDITNLVEKYEDFN